MTHPLRSAVAALILSSPAASLAAPTRAVQTPVPPIWLPAPPAPPAPPPRRSDSPALALGRQLAGLFTSDDYPVMAMERREQGAVTVELGITTTGRVGSCRIVASSGSAPLDRTTCQILTRRARFQPALDHSGQPVNDSVRQRIRWEMDSLPFVAAQSISVVRTNGVGVILSCRDETAFATCAEPDFDVPRMANLLAGALPPSSEMVRTMSFTPGEPRRSTNRKKADRGALYSGSATVEISRNGKIDSCIDTATPVAKQGRLCPLIEDILFRVAPDEVDRRTGEWTVDLRARPAG